MSYDVTHDFECVRSAFLEYFFRERWPLVCTKCGGVGSYTIPATRLDPPDGGQCVCLEDGHCPRCREDVILFSIDKDYCDYSLCPACGWNEWIVINNEQLAWDLDFLLILHECWCGMEEAQEEYERQLAEWEGSH